MRKRMDLMIDVMEALMELEPSVPFKLTIVGPPLTPQDQAYQQQLEYKVANKPKVSQSVQFLGHLPMAGIPAYYRRAFLHLNLSTTGSMDKTVMEALAAGCPVLTSNEAFRKTLSDFPQFIVTDEHPKAIARQILNLHKQRKTVDRQALRELVLGNHDLASYSTRIFEELRKIRNVQGTGESLRRAKKTSVCDRSV